jgi:hypothetical protein
MKIVIIETKSEFEEFYERSKSFDWIVVPTFCNGDKPVYIDSLSVLYIYVLQLDEEVMLVFNHTEGLTLQESILQSFPKETKLFVYNKKKFKKFLEQPNLIDMNMVEYFHNNQPIEDDFETPAHEFFTRNFGTFANLNTIIPITKHIEKSQAITQRFLDVFDYFQEDAAFKAYNEIILDSLYQIEVNGLFANYSLFKKKFEKGRLYENFAYSEYNPYTTTGRPSNRYGGINFAALKKDDGSRLPFVSRHGENGFMISFDYDAYHLRLLAELVDYKFPVDVSVHHYLGSFYFGKKELSDAEYQESKAISFRQLYGGIGEEYLEIPFFAQVHEYTKLLWNKYREEGYIETPVFGRKLFNSFFTDMNAAKLLNYLLQSFETERNMAVIHNLLSRISSYSSKLTLYTYDSFLFDFDRRDGGQILLAIKEELEQNGKYPVKIEIGPDYHNMQVVKRKI